MTTQQKQNKEVLLKLVEATTQEEVTNLVTTHPFFKSCQWRAYGDNPFNGGTIKGQSPDPVGALVEKITNGIDAFVTKLCWDAGIDPTSSSAPQSQYEAIKKFFSDDVAKFNLSDKEVREVASKTVRIIGEGTAEKPTISVIDFGEGQHPKDFPDTFLSINKGNKIKIQFAHGVYNQGGSAALKFCGNGYQLVLSRRAPNIKNGEEDLWGFTLVRENWKPGYKAEWFEYCTIDGSVPSFPYEPLKILPDKEALEGGSFVRLFSYSLKNPNFFITGQRDRELAREINKRYFSMPLPIQINEVRTQLRGWSEKNKVTRIYGLWRLLKKQFDDKKVIRTVLPLKAELGVFGLRNIEIAILNDEGDAGQSYKNQQEKIFLTVNGQAQHTESVNFLKTNCLLPDLAPYMIIHVDLSNAGYQANKIFHTARSGMIDIPEYDEFHKRLTDSIKGDETLKELNREYKERKLRNAQPEDKDLSRYIGRLVKDNPFLASLLNAGEEVPTEKPEGPKKEYHGEYIPTIFDLGDKEKEIPCNRYACLRIKTDATNDYLTRSKDKGEFRWTASKLVQINHYSLKNGFLPVRIEPVKDAKPGDTDTITFELTRPNQEPLKAELKIIIGKHEEPKTNPSGPHKPPTKLALKLPELKPVPKEDWGNFDWTGQDIVKVEEDQEGITVYINKEPDVLTEFPKRNPRYSSGDMMTAVQKRYLASVYLYSVAMFFDMKDEAEKRDWAIPASMRAISKFLLDLAFTTRISEQIEED
ncbi:MAG: hypothetical protein PHH50_03645 [Candidatus Pacebacteria bacterium]|nr:hypothetical protein [Candidatus Paceibacterota bacterium]